MKDIDFNENALFVRKCIWNIERILTLGKTTNQWVTQYINQVSPFIRNSQTPLLFVLLHGKKFFSICHCFQ